MITTGGNSTERAILAYFAPFELIDLGNWLLAISKRLKAKS